jgi:hypothetical protein
MRERGRLDQLETTIRRGKEAFKKVTLALLEIRDHKLYRETHRTFESYCRAVLGYSARYGNRLVRAAELILEREAKGLPLPANERQARVIREQAQADSLGGKARSLHNQLARERPGLNRTAEIEKLLARLRKLHAPHPWRTRADELLALYQETVLPWPVEG